MSFKQVICKIFPLIVFSAFLISCGAGSMPVKIDSSPGGASVYIDGNYKGTTPQRIFLYKRSRTITVKNTGYQSQTQIVNPRTTMTFWGFVFLPFWILSPEWKFEPDNIHFMLEPENRPTNPIN